MIPLEYENTEIQDKVSEIISLCDVIVDGPFLERMKNVVLPYAGSENQRVIDVNKTIKDKKIVFYESL